MNFSTPTDTMASMRHAIAAVDCPAIAQASSQRVALPDLVRARAATSPRIGAVR